MSAAAIQLDLTRLSEEERAQYDALLDRLDIAFAKIVEYLAAKSGCNNAASLPREARERLLVEASRLTDAFDQVHTDENDPDDDGESDAGPAEEDDPDDDGEPDAPDSDSDSEWDPDGAADKLADLDRDLLQLLARHHAELIKNRAFLWGAAMRQQRSA
jgi:hypothetical protein